MTGWLADRLEQVFPGLALPLALRGVFATVLLCTFWIYSDPNYAPGWFLVQMAQLTGIDAMGFHHYLYSHLVAFAVLMVLPLAVSWGAESMDARQLGLGIREAGREFGMVALLYVAFVPVLLLVAQSPSFQATYPRIPLARTVPSVFLWFQIAYLLKWTAWEFFFRGYLLFAFDKDLGRTAVLFSTIPFALVHYGKPPLEMYSSIAAGFILCWLAYRGRSIWPGVLLHWAVAGTMELFGTQWFWALFD